MDQKYYEQYIASIEGFPKEGIIFRDITPTLENPEAFQNLINDLCSLAESYDFDKIMCADARGFIVGSPLAFKCGKPLVIARKPGKLPRPGLKCSYDLEYGTNTLVISEGSIQKGDKVLIVDDLLATGGSAKAMMNMAKEAGATPVACVFYIELVDLHAKEMLMENYNTPVHSLVKYHGE